MKRLFLLSALLLASFSFAFADGGAKAKNDAAMKEGQKALHAKVIELEKNIQKKNAEAIEVSANDVLAIMRQGVGYTRQDASLMSGKERDARYQHMLKLENIVIDYMKYNKDASANGTNLIQTAKSFETAYH
ncbi:MAG: hypothetical protein JST06_01985 [Bacteroidetes bacterium]|nr:hypothetical protein [Bacteroidota bacterium]MBS1630091.1 hypothetical protein [Bacteroidota bacterium]